MQLSVNIQTQDIVSLISQMTLDEVEKVKNSLVKRELYFKPFQKDDLEDIVSDFQQEGYSSAFLTDLTEGLQKSSIYQ